MIMEILNICMTKECKVWTIKDHYRLGEDIQSKVLAFAFGLSAEIERNLISQRTKEALARKKAEGVILGRPKGRKSSPEKYKLSSKKVLITELLDAGISQRKIAKICKVDRNTLSRFIKNVLADINWAFYRIETWLRELLVKSGYNNESFIEFVREKTNSKKNVEHWKRKLLDIEPDEEVKRRRKNAERNSANQFQTFYLKDLLTFSQSNNIGPTKKECNIEMICDVRNTIAHSKDITNSSKEGDSMIFDMDGLRKFVDQTKMVEKLYRFLKDSIG